MTGESVPALSDSIDIDAAPDVVWELIGDVRRMTEFSPQVKSVRLRSGFDAVALGAQFTNLNRLDDTEWVTHGEIVVYEPGRELAFRIKENRVIWHYALEPLDGGGTRLHEERQTPDGVSELASTYVEEHLGGLAAFGVRLRESVGQTLRAVKAAAESKAS